MSSGRVTILERFVFWGMTSAEVEAVGQLPRGRGLLGWLIEHPEPLRLKNSQEHDASFGFPAKHPLMMTFLGVPVRVRGTIFGNLYLTDKEEGAEFSRADEELVVALAAAAGSVIDNARVYRQSELRRRWLEASASLAETLRSKTPEASMLEDIVARTHSAAGVRATTVLTEGGTVTGPRRDPSHVLEPLLREVVGGWQVTAKRLRREEIVVNTYGEASVVLMPLRTQLSDHGTIMVVSDADRRLTSEELILLGSFIDQAALTLDQAEALAQRTTIAVLEDRDRIARDLHDLIIQRLFATGLQLQATVARTDDVETRARLERSVAELDVTITDIRSAIFELHHGRPNADVVGDARGLVREYTSVLGFEPELEVNGPVATFVTGELRPQVLAVMREALSNVARHARATRAAIELDASNGEVALSVSDDGVGIPASTPESGLRNIRTRARERGGAINISRKFPQGTVLNWRVPVDAPGVSQPDLP